MFIFIGVVIQTVQPWVKCRLEQTPTNLIVCESEAELTENKGPCVSLKLS